MRELRKMSNNLTDREYRALRNFEKGKLKDGDYKILKSLQSRDITEICDEELSTCTYHYLDITFAGRKILEAEKTRRNSLSYILGRFFGV